MSRRIGETANRRWREPVKPRKSDCRAVGLSFAHYLLHITYYTLQDVTTRCLSRITHCLLGPVMELCCMTGTLFTSLFRCAHLIHYSGTSILNLRTCPSCSTSADCPSERFCVSQVGTPSVLEVATRQKLFPVMPLSQYNVFSGSCLLLVFLANYDSRITNHGLPHITHHSLPITGLFYG